MVVPGINSLGGLIEREIWTPNPVIWRRRVRFICEGPTDDGGRFFRPRPFGHARFEIINLRMSRVGRVPVDPYVLIHTRSQNLFRNVQFAFVQFGEIYNPNQSRNIDEKFKTSTIERCKNKTFFDFEYSGKVEPLIGIDQSVDFDTRNAKSERNCFCASFFQATGANPLSIKLFFIYTYTPTARHR